MPKKFSWSFSSKNGIISPKVRGWKETPKNPIRSIRPARSKQLGRHYDIGNTTFLCECEENDTHLGSTCKHDHPDIMGQIFIVHDLENTKVVWVIVWITGLIPILELERIALQIQEICNNYGEDTILSSVTNKKNNQADSFIVCPSNKAGFRKSSKKILKVLHQSPVIYSADRQPIPHEEFIKAFPDVIPSIG